METNLLDKMLSGYLAAQTPVTIILENKIRVSGKIRAFDSYVIIMEGQKHEIVYRHAMSSLAPFVIEEPKKASAPPQGKTAAKSLKTSPKTSAPAHRQRHQPQPAFPASSGEASINNGMKEGLLKWMQEQKAAK